MRTPRYRKLLAVLSSAVAIGGPLAAAAAAPAAAAERPGGVGQPIKDRYIVVLEKGASKADLQSTIRGALKAGGRKHHEYSAALTGFAATLPAKAVEALRKDDRVAFVEQDRVVKLDATQSPATWGLDRIDQRNLPLNNSYTYNYTGAGVRAYIIDTGMRLSHNEFTGRVTSGYDAIDGGTADDCNGHGTHVAGTVGGTTFGVAKQVQLVAVRVLNCQGSGTNSQVIAGINWVTSDHDAGERAVANNEPRRRGVQRPRHGGDELHQ